MMFLVSDVMQAAALMLPAGGGGFREMAPPRITRKACARACWPGTSAEPSPKASDGIKGAAHRPPKGGKHSNRL